MGLPIDFIPDVCGPAALEKIRALKAKLRRMVDQIDERKRKHWSAQEMLRKVEIYARVHFEGKYKDVYSTPTASQKLIFDLLTVTYPQQKVL